MARNRKISVDEEKASYKIYDLVDELKKVFIKADEMAQEGLTPQQIHRYLKTEGVEIEC